MDPQTAIDEFNAAVRARCPQDRQASYSERRDAIAFIARTKPDLHQAYLAATNPGARAERMLRENSPSSDHEPQATAETKLSQAG